MWFQVYITKLDIRALTLFTRFLLAFSRGELKEIIAVETVLFYSKVARKKLQRFS